MTVTTLRKPSELAKRQRLLCERNIIAAAAEAREYLQALVQYPGDLTWQLCQDVRACIGRIEANAQMLNAPPECDAEEAPDRDWLAARRV